MIKIDTIHTTTRSYLQDRGSGWIEPTTIDNATFQALTALLKESYNELSVLKGRDKNVRYVIDNDRIEYLEALVHSFLVYDETATFNVDKFQVVNNYLEVKNVWHLEEREIEIVTPSRLKRDKLNHLLSDDFPECVVMGGNVIKVAPSTIISDVSVDYLKEPTKPVWTFNLVGGNSFFVRNSQTVDVDLPSTEFDNLMTKILELLGVPLRSQAINQTENAKDSFDQQFKDRT